MVGERLNTFMGDKGGGRGYGLTVRYVSSGIMRGEGHLNMYHKTA